ncbi:MAG: glycosyltransferase family 61 protein [Candidatus Synoicihabitans palmerolidicus]|nr:glycosyltransferase family 61 protein [Candidatus Synoicihabitans palmerolidicus]
MVDSVSRADLFLKAGFEWDDVDHILIPATAADCEAVRLTELQLRMPLDKVQRLTPQCQVSCEFLIQPSLPSVSNGSAPWVVEFHRNILSPVEPQGSGRLFIPRYGSRSLTNQREVEVLLAEHGFDLADMANFSHLRRQVGAARHVVAVHGAAMTNLIYAASGTRVLELIPTDHLNGSYRCMCAWKDMPYAAIAGPSLKSHGLYSGMQKTIHLQSISIKFVVVSWRC